MPSDSDANCPLFAGIDVGGTNVKIGLVDDQGRIVAASKFPTHTEDSPDLAIRQARCGLDELVDSTEFSWNDVAAVGLGTPGPMDIQSGKILTPTNLPGWHNYPIQLELAKAVERPVTFANDAAAAAFGEYWVGGGQAYPSIVLLTLGTGVGGGIIVNDFSIDGANSHGAEVGHMVVETGSDARICGCGQKGHLEAYASATALVNRTQEAMEDSSDGIKTVLSAQVSEAAPLSALMISNAATAGDELAQRMVSETAVYLGRGIAQLAHVIDPAAFILGGAMNFGGPGSESGQRFLAEVKTEVSGLVFPVLAERLVVKFAALGSDAGFVGAAGLARAQYNRNLVNSIQT